MKASLNLVWWYWFLTTILLSAVVTGISFSIHAVIVLNAIQVLHFIYRERSITAFPVQVRIVYFSLLFLAQAPYMFWIFWWQLIGTAAMVSFRYCFLARCISLMPWNKTEAYSFAYIKRTFLSAPVDGNILQGLPSNSN